MEKELVTHGRGSEWVEGGGGKPNVGCRLKFHHFVGCRLNFSIFPMILLMINKTSYLFLSVN